MLTGLSMKTNERFCASVLRQKILDMAYAGSSVHIPCAFSIVETLAVLYRSHLRYPENDPNHPLRDYLVLSKGHGVMAQYVCLFELGWIARHDLENYFKDGTKLRGLSESDVAGLEVNSGSLGHGLNVGVGLALAAKLNQTDQVTYAIVGDGEANEGTVWEALQFATHFRLDNLIVIFDKNGFQAMGATDDVMGLGDLDTKLQAFGFDAVSVDGHDEIALDKALVFLKELKNGRPKGIVAHTIKGKGVSFMERQNVWHYTRLDKDTYVAASNELSAGMR
jgi:transketolase